MDFLLTEYDQNKDFKAKNIFTKNFQDEPAAHQSDPSVLDLQLRALSRSTTTKELTVKKVVHGPQTIERWIRDISDLHQSKVVSPCPLKS